MITFPNAKINLGLNIVGKRPDGYHNLETVFYPIPLMDALEVVDADEFSFTQSGIVIGGRPAENLVVKALNLLKQHYDIPPLAVYLLKKIPFGAGLGGGSSDAACMLKLVNDFCALGIPTEKLEQLAGTIDADCPFFIQNKPVFAQGTGNIFEPVSLSLKGYTIVLVKPEIAVSTAEAYAGITPALPHESIRAIIQRPVAEWKDRLINDFESTIFNKHPRIGAIKEALYDNGAAYAAMSGSGSAVFGLYEQEPEQLPSFDGCFTWKGAL